VFGKACSSIGCPGHSRRQQHQQQQEEGGKTAAGITQQDKGGGQEQAGRAMAEKQGTEINDNGEL
jgi:hypothetical protein